MNEHNIIGARVTRQPRTWYDGTPVANWPQPEHVGIVKRISDSRGAPLARVKWASGRIEWAICSELQAIHD